MIIGYKLTGGNCSSVIVKLVLIESLLKVQNKSEVSACT